MDGNFYFLYTSLNLTNLPMCMHEITFILAEVIFLTVLKILIFLRYIYSDIIHIYTDTLIDEI